MVIFCSRPDSGRKNCFLHRPNQISIRWVSNFDGIFRSRIDNLLPKVQSLKLCLFPYHSKICLNLSMDHQCPLIGHHYLNHHIVYLLRNCQIASHFLLLHILYHHPENHVLRLCLHFHVLYRQHYTA